MKIAVLADIHGNSQALKAVIEHANNFDIDKYIIAGDHISDCPSPNETLNIIQKLDSYVIKGNREDYILNEIKSIKNEWIGLKQMESVLWTKDSLTRDHINWIDELPETLHIKYKNTKAILLVHGSPDDQFEHLYPHKIKRLTEVLKSIKEAISESKLAKYSGQTRKQRNRISVTQLKICESPETLLKALVRDVTLFSEQERKRQHLSNVEQLIIDIQLGFKKLKIVKAEPILDACLNFVKTHLIRNPQATSQSSIELFADIISSFEFYLDTLKFTSEPSSRILEFAENSLSQLQTSLKVNFNKNAN